jgi:hypothetical protein
MSFRCNECQDNMNAGDVKSHVKKCRGRDCKHPSDRRVLRSSTGFLCYEGCLECNMWLGKPICLPGGIYSKCSCSLCRGNKNG